MYQYNDGYSLVSSKIRFDKIFDLAESLGVKQPYSILDVGCGHANLLKYMIFLDIKYKEYMGIEKRENVLNYLREFQNSMEQVYFNSDIILKYIIKNMYDLVLLSGAISDNSIPKEKQLNTLYNLWFLLNHKTMIFTLPNSSYNNKKEHITYFSLDEVIKIIKDFSPKQFIIDSSTFEHEYIIGVNKDYENII